MKVLQTSQDLLHDDSDLILFIQLDEAFSALLLDPLGQAHVHSLKDQVEPAILVLDALSLHHVGAVLARSFAIDHIKALQYLHLSLLQGFLLGLILVLKLFDSILFASLDMFALINVTKAP